MIHLVCYDIADDARRQRIAKTLEQFGLRVQKSYFQCDLDPQRLGSLKQALLNEIDRRQDRLFFYPICSACNDRVLRDGTGLIMTLEPFEIL